MLFGIAREDEREGAVACHVAGGAKAVLKGEDREHERGAGIVKQKHTGDDAERSHDRAAGDTGGSYGEYPEQYAEQDHGPERRNGAVQDLGYGHAEEHFCEDRSAEVDVREKRDAELYHILSERRLRLVGALERDAEGGCR